MKLLVLKDKLISTDEMIELERQFIDLYYENADITPVFFVEERDFSDYPTEIDSDGDVRIKHTYMQSITDDIYKRYSGEGTDHVVFLIHKKNWKSAPRDGRQIWGTNYSSKYNGYQVQYCRFDTRMANSLGTLYHEVMHSHDNLIQTYLGVNVTSFLNIPNWDKDIVHGSRPEDGKYGYQYIRYTENLGALRYIAPYLKQAYAKRATIYNTKVSMLKQISNILPKLIVLLRGQLCKKSKF